MMNLRDLYPFILKLFILVLLGGSLYAQTLDDPFHFDDAVTIVGNQAVHRLPDWPTTAKGLLAFQPSRFITNITFALNYYAGRLDTEGYHAINILVHLITALLVWWMGNLLVGLTRTSLRIGQSPMKQSDTISKIASSSAKKRGGLLDPASLKQLKGKLESTLRVAKTAVSSDQDPKIPFLAALVFLAHPVNTQAVSYLSQRSEALAAMFYMASVCCYIQGRISGTKRTPYLVGSIVCGLLASFSKETAVTLPLMIIVIELFFLRTQVIVLPRQILFAVLGLVFIVLIPSAFNFNYARMLAEPHLSQSHLGDVLTLQTYLLTQIRVFVTFLRLVFIPVGLNLDYDYPMIQTFFDPAFLGSLGVLTAIGAGAFSLKRKSPMLSFAAAWFFLTMSSNLVPRAHVMFEHKLYLVLAGLLPALCLGSAGLVRNRRVMTVGLFCIIVLFSVITFQRNHVWNSEIALWEDVLKRSPNKARVHLSLGTAYARAGQYDRAHMYMTNAIGMLGEPHRAYSNRGAVYVKMKKDDLAMADLNQAIALEPYFPDAYVNRSEIFARMKNYGAALEDLGKVIGIDPLYAPAYRMRGRIFDAMGQYDQARADYNRALALDPGDAQALAWRGYLHALAGKMAEAFADFNAALGIDENFSDAYIYRGMYYKERGQKDAAFRDFDKALALRPDSPLAYYQRASALFDFEEFESSLADVNKAIILDEGFDLPYSLRGIIRARREQYAPAMEDFNKAIALHPNSAAHYINRAKLLKILGDTSGMNKDIEKAKSLGLAVKDRRPQ